MSGCELERSLHITADCLNAETTEVRQWVLSFLMQLLPQQFAVAGHDPAVGDDQ